MRPVTSEQMRALDRRTIEEAGIPGEELMERAGLGVFSVMQRLMDVAGFTGPAINILAGRGNNGGDAFAVARMLKEAGHAPWVWLCGAIDGIQGDALTHFNLMRQAGVTFAEVSTKDDWEGMLYSTPPGDLVVDGILGTGASGPARGPAAGAVQFANAASEAALIVAIDVPSGLNADTGRPEGEVVRADITVTMGLPKTGLVAPEALEYVGNLEVIDIGIPAEYVDEVASVTGPDLIYSADLRPLIPRRPRGIHKGDCGRVLLVGGAVGYMGAIAMASRSAVRSGAGLVTTVTPGRIAPEVSVSSLETMVVSVDDSPGGGIHGNMAGQIVDLAAGFDAVLVGPGMTRSPDTLQIVEALLDRCDRGLVLDADALAVLEDRLERLARAKARVIITPHPGEMSMLCGRGTDDIQENRRAVAEEAATLSGAVVVLKGAGTLVAAKDRPTAINLTGNPGMATGGSGDVLAGLMVGLLGLGMEPYDAARAAVYLHGRAGDLVALRKSQAGLNATDIIEELPYAFRDIALR